MVYQHGKVIIIEVYEDMEIDVFDILDPFGVPNVITDNKRQDHKTAS